MLLTQGEDGGALREGQEGHAGAPLNGGVWALGVSAGLGAQ